MNEKGDKTAVLVRVGFNHWIVPSSMVEAFLLQNPHSSVIGQAGSALAELVSKPTLREDIVIPKRRVKRERTSSRKNE